MKNRIFEIQSLSCNNHGRISLQFAEIVQGTKPEVKALERY